MGDEAEQDTPSQLFRIDPKAAGGLSLVGSEPLSKDMLNSDGVYFLLTTLERHYLWVGKKSTSEAKSGG